MSIGLVRDFKVSCYTKMFMITLQKQLKSRDFSGKNIKHPKNGLLHIDEK